MLRKADKPVVVIGTKSALFLPYRKLGVIIVDEEQDPRTSSRSRHLVITPGIRPSFWAPFTAHKSYWEVLRLLLKAFITARQENILFFKANWPPPASWTS